MTDSFEFLNGSAAEVAPRLLGCILERDLDGVTVRVRIVETEAYDQSDAASHSFSGRTPRNDVMFGPAGHLYVYFTYGMHYCCNIVTGAEGEGSAVLIRAVEPIGGEDVLARRRGGRTGVHLTNGPAKLCRALGIDRAMNGHDLRIPPLSLIIATAFDPSEVIVTPRVGITRNADVPLRFYVRGNTYVSKP